MDGFMTYERVRTQKGQTFRAIEDYGSSDDEIYVLDTETTGLFGAPKDVVVDVGICKVSLEKGTVEDVYSSVLGYDTDEWDDYLKNAWIFENTDMTLDMVEEAPPALNVIADVRRLLRKKPVTSYNTEYDFGKFLYEEPWSMRGWFVECCDIMKAAPSPGRCSFPPWALPPRSLSSSSCFSVRSFPWPPSAPLPWPSCRT